MVVRSRLGRRRGRVHLALPLVDPGPRVTRPSCSPRTPRQSSLWQYRRRRGLKEAGQGRLLQGSHVGSGGSVGGGRGGLASVAGPAPGCARHGRGRVHQRSQRESLQNIRKH